MKQIIDEYMFNQTTRTELIQEAKFFLLEREIRLVNARRNTIDGNSYRPTGDGSSINSLTSILSESESIHSTRRESKIFSNSLISKITGRINNSPDTIIKHENFDYAAYPKFNEAQHVAICAVLLDEWVKELAALSQEHTVSQITTMYK